MSTTYIVVNDFYRYFFQNKSERRESAKLQSIHANSSAKPKNNFPFIKIWSQSIKIQCRVLMLESPHDFQPARIKFEVRAWIAFQTAQFLFQSHKVIPTSQPSSVQKHAYFQFIFSLENKHTWNFVYWPAPKISPPRDFSSYTYLLKPVSLSPKV